MALRNTDALLTNVRTSYAHLLQPYSNSKDQEPKYSVTLLIPKTDTANYQRLQGALAAAKQLGVQSRWSGVSPAVLPEVIHDGDGLRQDGAAFGPECKGMWVITARSKQAPEIVGPDRLPLMSANDIYSGMWVNVVVSLFPYFNSGKKGVGVGLGPIQKVRDDAPLGGVAPRAADVFGEVTPQPAATSAAPAQGLW